MKPYYERGGVTLYHARAEEVLAALPDNSVDLIATDPPYFGVKSEAWDNQWKNAGAFLEWMDGLMIQWRRILKPNGSLYVFASPQMSARVEVLTGKYFEVLNNIRWVKDAGWHNKAEKEALRAYLEPWEACVFAEQFGREYEDAATSLHKAVYAPLGRYIQQERERAGLTRNAVEVGLGFVSGSDPTRGTALCYRWEEGSSLPTRETYERMRAFLNSRDGEYLKREYEDLRREYEDLRRPFYAPLVGVCSDVWNFPTAKLSNGKHVCEKPLAMMEHIIRTSSRPGAVVLDCFAGSGTTLRAAKNLGRKCIGVEMDAHWCRQIVNRVAQECLFSEVQ